MVAIDWPRDFCILALWFGERGFLGKTQVNGLEKEKDLTEKQKRRADITGRSNFNLKQSLDSSCDFKKS